MRKKRLAVGMISALMALGVVQSANNSSVFADERFTFVAGYNYDSDQEFAPASKSSPEEIRDYGTVESKYPKDVNKILNSYPQIRNQGSYGTCWHLPQ